MYPESEKVIWCNDDPELRRPKRIFFAGWRTFHQVGTERERDRQSLRVDEVESVLSVVRLGACNKSRGWAGGGKKQQGQTVCASGWSIWPPALICTARMTSLARDVTAVV